MQPGYNFFCSDMHVFSSDRSWLKRKKSVEKKKKKKNCFSEEFIIISWTPATYAL